MILLCDIEVWWREEKKKLSFYIYWYQPNWYSLSFQKYFINLLALTLYHFEYAEKNAR